MNKNIWYKFATKKSKLNRWLYQHKNDHFVKESKRLNYRSRAAFKLLEINKKFSLIKENSKIIDLGCSPGGWSQVASEIVGKSQQIVGIDLLDMKEIENVIFVKGDMRQKQILNKVQELGFIDSDLIMSDMAPNLSGNMGDIDEIQELNLISLEYVDKCLQKGGNMIMKSFDGENEGEIFKKIKERFKQCLRFKGEVSRRESSEFYYIGLKHMK